MSDFDLRSLLEALNVKGVRFVVIGGVAVGAHGYVRGTEDLDLVPDPGPRRSREPPGGVATQRPGAGRCAIICGMEDQALEELPGAEIVLPGISDLEAGRMSASALAVQSAAPRLRELGFEAKGTEGEVPAAHQLYQQLHQELGDAAHSRYNAILSRVTSFARAAERARAGWTPSAWSASRASSAERCHQGRGCT